MHTCASFQYVVLAHAMSTSDILIILAGFQFTHVLQKKLVKFVIICRKKYR